MANGWGGARPGAGGKKDLTKDRQLSNRDQLLSIGEELCPPTDPDYPNMPRSEAFARSLWTRAMAGDPIATANLIPHLFGGRPTAPVEHTGSVDFNLINWSKPWSPTFLNPAPTVEGQVREITTSDDQPEDHTLDQ